MSPRKNAAALTPANVTPATSVVEVLDSTPATSTSPLTLSFIVASDKVRANEEAKVSGLMVENSLHSVRAEKSFESLAAETLRLRRMFPATPGVQAILGEDSPDLLGLSQDYKAAQGRVNDTARDSLILALRKEGMTVKGATSQADAEMERIRQSVSRYVRIAVEAEAKAIGGDEGAKFLLGHGFRFSSVVTSKNNPGVIADKAWKLVKDANTGEFALVKPATPAIDAPPSDSTDQTNPEELAESVIKELAKEGGLSVTDVAGHVNLAVGELRSALGALNGGAEVTSEDRVRLARLIGTAAYETMEALGIKLEGSDRIQVARMFEQISAVSKLRMSPEPASK